MKTIKLSRNSTPTNILRSTGRSIQKQVRSATSGTSGIGRELRRRASWLPGVSAPAPKASSRGMMGSAAVIAAAVGLGYAIQRYAGRNIMSIIRGLRGRQRESGFVPGRSYGNVHGTEGARMPEAKKAKRPQETMVE